MYVDIRNIMMNLLTTESHLNPALQIADLVVGIVTKICMTPHSNHMYQYWELLKPREPLKNT